MDFETGNEDTQQPEHAADEQQETPTARILTMPQRAITPEPEGTPEPEAAPEVLAEPPADGIQAFDQDGRPVIVPRAEWIGTVLPGMVRESWDNPDQLYLVILNSLNEGFFAEMTDAAERLYATDPLPARGAAMWGIVLTQTGRLDEAEQVLRGYGENHPADGSVLVNLSRVYAAQGHGERATATLREALQIEPNLENGLGWYVQQAAQGGGDPAAKAALEEIAANPASWRAQLWLARGEMGAGNLDAAMQLYVDSLNRSPRPVPAELLMQMSGDLGQAGQLVALVELTRPAFVPEVHGLPVANNLIKALVDLSAQDPGLLDLALSIKRSLDPFNRPDWKEALGFWETEIVRRKGAAEGGVQIGMLRVDGALWLPPGSPARALFGTKSAGPSVTFLGGSAESPEAEEGVAPQLADELARMTRALPLYLAEQVELRTAAEGRALLPWATGAASGFVVSGARWPDATALGAVAEPDANGQPGTPSSDYVVTVHIDGEVEPWTADLTFLRSADGARIGELSAEFDPNAPEAALPKLADEVVELLSAMAPAESAGSYAPPPESAFRAYLLRLEQLMATRCAAIPDVPSTFLNGDRDILAGALDLAYALPGSVPARLLLIETLGAMQRVRPQVIGEFGPAFQQLVEEKPLPALDQAFSAATGAQQRV